MPILGERFVGLDWKTFLVRLVKFPLWVGFYPLIPSGQLTINMYAESRV